MKEKIKKIHFVGVAGSGMSGIAQVLHNQNYIVSGSDLQDSDMLKQLSAMGVKTFVGHNRQHVADADVVVVSTAVRNDNVEIQEARYRKIPVVPRAVMLAELMRLKRGIAVAGTHGKTTTTSLVASILASAGLDPTFVIGGRLNGIGDNARVGTGKYLVAEADESDASFLNLSPIISVVTNIDKDHMQTYNNSFETLKQTFVQFLQKLPFYGAAVLCIDDDNIKTILDQVACPIISYGLDETAQIRAVDVKVVSSQMHFVVQRKGVVDLPIVLNLPGIHNVRNALAAIAVATLLDIDSVAIQTALEQFKGVDRRFQRYSDISANGGKAVLIDDYGHHPVEMQATIAAVRGAFPKRRLLLVFQPHRYSRTRDCFEDFVKVLGEGDLVFLTEVYPAGEEAIVAADGRSLTRAVRVAAKVDPVFIENVLDLPNELANHLQADDVVLCMGAGSIAKVAPSLEKMLGGNNE